MGMLIRVVDGRVLGTSFNLALLRPGCITRRTSIHDMEVFRGITL